jgi:hypothetical protein
MDFEEFWESTKKFLVQGAELETISRANFKTNFDSAGGVIVVIPHSTNLPRDINKNDFKNVFEKMKDLNRRYDNVFRPALYQRITIIKAVQTQGGKQKTFEKTKNVT